MIDLKLDGLRQVGYLAGEENRGWSMLNND